MKKRILCIMTALTIMFTAAAARTGYIAATVGAEAAAEQSGRTLTVGSVRGIICDINNRTLVCTCERFVAAVAPTRDAVNKLSSLGLDDAVRALSAGNPVLVEVERGFSAEGAYVFSMPERYTSADIAEHIVGYLDGEGHGICGVEKAFDGLLYGGNISVTFSRAADGGVLSGIGARVNGNAKNKSAVILTLDSRIQNIAENAAASLGTGAVVVLDSETSEIRGLCSVPGFDRKNVGSALSDERSPLLNRALSLYNVGSVFKLCLVAAALEAGEDSFEYTCNGSVTVGTNVFSCHRHSGHGRLNLTEALSVSCNPYFIALGQRLGADKILEMCKKMRLDTPVELCAGVSTDGGLLPEGKELKTQPAALANFSFGQGKLMMSPLTLAAMTAAMVNGGIYREPSLIKATVDEKGNRTDFAAAKGERVLSEKISDRMRELMITVVEKGSGANAKPETVIAGGKTASAETGWYKDGKEVTVATFTGFCDAPSGRYVITVLGENGVSGSATAAPVFKRIADGIAAL